MGNQAGLVKDAKDARLSYGSLPFSRIYRICRTGGQCGRYNLIGSGLVQRIYLACREVALHLGPPSGIFTIT